MILQCVDATGTIVWQKYFYGGTPGLEGAEYRRGACARGISVWAATTPEETRIAICGEQNDDLLPMSQSAGGWVQAPLTKARPDFTGFIAVYDGRGELLWTHHFFGDASSAETNLPDCAITDVSIRTQVVGESLRDIVTYCGISTHGVPISSAVPLAPRLPFAAIDLALLGCGGGFSSGGATQHGAFQWDGIVGRLSHDHVLPLATTTQHEFHSIVGGPEQDGLFGIAELEEDRFVVVGGSSRLDFSGSAAPFPFTTICPPTVAHRVGVVLAFNAAPTRVAPNPLPLVLDSSYPLGAMGPSSPGGVPFASIARDVLVQLDFLLDPTGASSSRGAYCHIVGATDDPNFFTPMTTAGAGLSSLRGPSDGFVLSSIEGFPIFQSGGFIGGDGEDGLTGISSWNEHTDHMHVSGYSVDEAGNTDIQVATVLLNNACEFLDVGGGVFQLVSATDPMVQLRRDIIGGTLEDRPAVIGWANATENAGPPLAPASGGQLWLTGLETGLPIADSVGNPAGGGIAVDPRGRASVMGRTRSAGGASGYPVTVAPFAPGRSFQGSDDAVHTQLDMLPLGVSRSDGTGSRVSTVPPFVPAPLPPSGFTGGTTPTCGLSPFGRRVHDVWPLLPRMLVEFEGVNSSGQSPAFVFSRPPSTGLVLGTILQIGFPGVVGVPGPEVTELWLLDPSAFIVLAPYVGWGYPGFQSWRFRLPFPLTVSPIAAQLVCLSTCDGHAWACNACVDGFAIVASPAMTVEF